MKKYAVVGTGSIGSLLGGYLSHGGYDVTMLSAFRRERAEFLRENGLSIGDLSDDRVLFHTDIKAAALSELTDEVYDVMLLALKSNDLETVMPKLCTHLAPDGFVVTFQNGINEDKLIPIVGKERVVIGCTFAGGRLKSPGLMCSHEGYFVVGEMDGTITARVQELGKVLECCRPTIVSDKARSYQWDKMGRVCLSVPSACISGLFLGDVFMEPRLQKQFAHLALEILNVARADGFPLEALEGKSYEEWQRVAAGTRTGLEDRDPGHWAPGIVDAYTSDMRKGLPLEVVNTNGAVSRLGRLYGVPTPANDEIVRCIKELEAGTETRGFHLVDRVLAACGA